MIQHPKLNILVPFAALAVISLIGGVLTPAKRRRADASSSAMSPAPVDTQVAAESSTFERKTKKMGYAAWGRSPFLQKTEAVVTPTKLILAGIAWDDQGPKAVINDQIVGVGDKVGGNTVVSIKKDRVIMNDGSSDFELR